MDKEIIARNFSRCAHLYDSYANIQQKVALELLRCLEQNDFSSVLEIGCGTGNYTSLLKERFARADFKAIDISQGMIDVARSKLQNQGVEFITGDAENILFHESFGLITSNASFQWFQSLKSSLIRYKNYLEEEGVFCFSVFGPCTFKELNEVIGEGPFINPIAAANFIDQDQIKEILSSHFKSVKFWEAEYTETLPSLKDLLEKIKHTGVRGGGIYRRGVFTSYLLAKLERSYLDRFKEIRATYQIFYFWARRG